MYEVYDPLCAIFKHKTSTIKKPVVTYGCYSMKLIFFTMMFALSSAEWYVKRRSAMECADQDNEDYLGHFGTVDECASACQLHGVCFSVGTFIFVLRDAGISRTQTWFSARCLGRCNSLNSFQFFVKKVGM